MRTSAFPRPAFRPSPFLSRLSPIRRLAGAAALVLAAAACGTTGMQEEETRGGPYTVTIPTPPKRLPAPVLASAPLDTGATLTRIAFGSCFGQNGSQEIWTAIAEADPDLFLFIGDNVYGDVRPDDPRFTDPDMPAMREAYASLAESEPFAALREAVPVLAVWDDHDYGANDTGADYPLRDQSEALFESVWNVPDSEGRAQRPGIYQAWMVGAETGRKVQIILLDTRYFRSALTPTDAPGVPGKEFYIPYPGTDRTMLGEAQWRWLNAQLNKPADLRLIVSSVQVIAEGFGGEAWRLLPAERQRLYNMINSAGAENVVLLSGDRHAAALYRKDVTLAYPLYEVTASAMNLPIGADSDRARAGEPGPNRLGEMYYDANFGLIDIDWEEESLTMQIMDEAGSPVRTQTISLWDLRPVY